MKRSTILLAGLGVVALGLQSAGASSPDSSSIAVPKAGPQQVQASWKGTLSPGFDGPGFEGCKDNVYTQATDAHTINLTVPAGTYDVVKAKLTVTVSSGPTLNGDIIELVDPSGASAGTDQQHPDMSVEVANPAAGAWKLLVCEFLPDGLPSHDYNATVVIKTICKGTSPCPAPPKRRRR